MSTCKLKTANYPDYLGWGRLATVVKLGTVIQDADGQQYVVKEKLLSDVVGAQPRLRLEPVNHVPEFNANSDRSQLPSLHTK